MTHDSAEPIFRGKKKEVSKLPRHTSIRFIQQFARVCAPVKGFEFSYCILN